MKITTLIFVFILLLAGGARAQKSGNNSALKATIARLGREYSAMIQRNDAKAIENILADDYLLADEVGTVYTKSQDLATYAGRAKSVKIETVEYKDQKVRIINGTVAIDHATIRFVGSRNGKPFDITERCTTVWALRNGKWKIVADHFSYLK